jgi:hypothetical protein
VKRKAEREERYWGKVLVEASSLSMARIMRGKMHSSLTLSETTAADHSLRVIAVVASVVVW